MIQSSSNTIPKRRHVSFCDDRVQIPPLTASDKSSSEVPPGDLWYTKTELSFIKHDVAKVLIHRIKDQMNIKHQHAKVDHDDPELWGLERHGIERHHSKKAAIKMILLAQNMKESKTDPEFLRNVSLYCSKEALNHAREQGFRDSCCIYYEESLEKLVDDCIFDCCIPSSIGHKRSQSTASFSFADNQERRVRSRTSAA